MKKRSIIFILLFLFSSCSFRAKISEHILIKKNASSISGTYTLILDLTDSHSIISAMKRVEGNDQDLDVFVYNAFHEAAHSLSQISGIDKITLSYDQRFLRFTLSFGFSSLKSLNRAVSIIDNPRKSKATFTIEDGGITRTMSAMEDIFSKHKNAIGHETEKDKELVRFRLFFKDIKWVTTYSLEGYKIRALTNGYKEISSDKKTIVYEHFIVDMDGCRHTIFIS